LQGYFQHPADNFRASCAASLYHVPRFSALQAPQSATHYFPRQFTCIGQQGEFTPIKMSNDVQQNLGLSKQHSYPVASHPGLQSDFALQTPMKFTKQKSVSKRRGGRTFSPILQTREWTPKPTANRSSETRSLIQRHNFGLGTGITLRKALRRSDPHHQDGLAAQPDQPQVDLS
jgi:hypothetical protein